MKFALLGSDAESLALSEAALTAGHQLIWVGDVPNRLEHADWQVLLDRQTADVVLVGRGQAEPEVRAEQLESLAKQGITVLATHPVVPSVLSYFEIDMSRDESGALFRYYHPTAEHPVVEQLAAWIRQGQPKLGMIEQIVCQRGLAERTRERVLWHFARDVLLLARLGGCLNRLGALGSPSSDATYAALSVQMIGQLERPVHWSVGPEDGSPGLQLTLVGQQGRLLLQLDEAGMPRRQMLHLAGAQEELPQLGADFNPAAEAVKAICLALREADGIDVPPAQGGEHANAADSHRDQPQASHCPRTTQSTWREALLAMELTDTIEISLRRGRMIDVHQQQLTEYMAFKGMMSAIGCGLLLVLPMLLLGLGWIAGEMGLPVASYWPHGLLLLLGLFLALQALPWLLYSKCKSAEKG